MARLAAPTETLLVSSMSSIFFHYFEGVVLVGLQKHFINNFIFKTWACADDFNNNNNYYNNNNENL